MKKLSTALYLLLIPSVAFAESCEEKFARLLIDGNGEESVRIMVTQEIKGGMKTINEMLYSHHDHWISKAIEPSNMAWSMVYNNALYTSADKGESWSKVREIDSLQMLETGRESRRKDADTIRDAVCAEEEVDGLAFDTVEATYDVTQGFKSTNRYKYWVDRETSRIVKATYDMKADNFESFTTQVLELAPNIVVPKPE